MNENEKRVYDVVDVQKILGLGRSSAYEFLGKVYLEQSPFTVIRIGRLYKIPKEPFDIWVSGVINE